MSDPQVFVASPEAKGKAKQLRIFAVIAWLLAMGGQAYAIFNLISDEMMVWLIRLPPIGHHDFHQQEH